MLREMKVVMMKARTLGPFVMLILLMVSAFAVPTISVGHEGNDPRIVCANSILADFTSNVVGDLARVDYLMPSGVCPSHYDSRPSDAELVADADIIVMMGWEGWLNGLIESTGRSEIPVIRCMAQGDQNLPADAKRFVDHIASGLSEVMEDDAATLSANAESYKAHIDAKDMDLKARVETAGVDGSKVVVMEWQRAFVESLGFLIVGTFGPPEGLSVQDQLNVATTASGEDVAMVVDNLQSGTEFGAQVAVDTGKEHVVLTNYPAAAPDTNTYLDMIDYNTDQLIDGAKRYEYKQGEIADLEGQVKDLEYRTGLYLTMAVIFLIVALFLGVLLVRSRSRGD